MNERKANGITELVGYVGAIVVTTLIVIWFTIDASYHYGWYAGSFHGAWVPYNWIRSLFDGSILFKAPMHSSAYTFWWWIGLIVGIFALINIITGIIGSARKAFRS